MYCVNCGALNDESSAFCFKCGGALSQAAIDAGTTSTDLYAGFWRRAGGYLIDYCIWIAAIWLALLVLSVAGQSDVEVGTTYLILTVVGPWLYSALFESGPWQATPGKKAVGVKVTDQAGRRISFGRASGRFFAEMLSGLTIGIGYLMAAFTPRRQALHDMIAGTVVVHAGADTSRVAGRTVASPVPGWVVALIVLGAMVPILGILAAIAIPAYQDYTIRAQVSEGLILSSDIKDVVAEYTAQTGDWPEDLAQASVASATTEVKTTGKYVESIEVENGTITITYGNGANPRIAGLVLSLQPLINEEGDVVWVCGNADYPNGTYINSAGALGVGNDSVAGTTGLLDKQLPAACRSGFGGT